VVFVFGGCVGFLVSSKLKPMPVELDEDGDIVYICSGKPSCYRMVAVCGGVAMKPLKQCEHCSKIKKKSR